MELHQFALYQLKDLPENRLIRFRPYETLQKQNIQVRCENYEQKYIGQMGEGDTPASVRKRFDEHLPRTFSGHSISVSDVLVLNHQGEVTSYYVEEVETLSVGNLYGEGYTYKIAGVNAEILDNIAEWKISYFESENLDSLFEHMVSKNDFTKTSSCYKATISYKSQEDLNEKLELARKYIK